ncbi:MAG TPA: FecR domain-containing protein [Pyrinomonadaceae bacterium]|nr:FecR domain-containing protein [Pyrinomonadaceae bacterium]
MKHNNKYNEKEADALLDRVTASIRDEEIDSALISSAAARAWSRLSVERTSAAAAEIAPAKLIEGCADFQTLIPAYVRGDLSEARALLFEDHTHECIPCRKALKQARTSATPAPRRAEYTSGAAKGSAPAAPWRWAIAATLVLGFGLAAFTVFHRYSNSGAARAIVIEISGPVYSVSDTDSRPVRAGEEIPKGEKIRTAKDAYAVVRLEDGSLVETKERSEFSVSENSQGVTLHLDRGNVIVQAAKQRQRHLYVATPDSLVSVTGTIFSVNSGTKGSRVSVVEGEVHVNHAGSERVLHPGDQTTTQASLELVPIKDEIAWSRQSERYVKLLSDLAAMRNEVNARVAQPEVRFSTRFLDLLPEGTVLYAALPNISVSLSESHKIMQERINQNPALREWWDAEQAKERGGPRLDQMIGQIREFGEYLGDEIVASAEMNERGEPDNFLVLGELKNSEGFRPYVEQKIKAINLAVKNGPTVRIVDDPQSAAASPSPAGDAGPHNEILVWIQKDFFAAAPKLEQLQKLQTATASAGARPFAATPFYSRIAETYREGAGLVVAADLEKIIASAVRRSEASKDEATRIEAYRKLGLLDLKHFIVEQREAEGKTQSRASLTFNEGRRGIASWLAAPGPMGALEYVSPDANVVAAFVVKEPTALVDDLLGFLETASPDLRKKLQEMEASQGLNIRNDFATPLGGEFAFAIDGPILPAPSWKMVFEVYDQSRLQQTFERVVEQLNRRAATEGRAGLQWERTEDGGRTFYALKSGAFGLEVHYAYAGGYLVAAPSRALVDRAIRYRESGYTLLRSPRFTAGLPADGNANFSALLYHDLAPLIEPLAERVAKSKSLPEDQQQAIRALGATQPPTLAYAYAQGDRIVLASNTEGGPFGLSPSSILGLPNAFAIQHIMHEAMSEKNSKR